MKRVIVLMLMLMASTAYSQNCLPIPPEEFRLELDRLRALRSDRAIYDRSVDMMDRYCLTVEQVASIAALFRGDDLRLLFTRDAYLNVLNPQDYFEVLDTFTKFSSAFKLYDFLVTQGPPIINQPPLEVVPVCLTTDAELKSVLATLQKENFPMRRLPIAIDMTKNRCLSVGQIRKVVDLLSIGDDKLALVKSTFDNCTNQLDYHQLIDVMTFQTDKDELLRFIQSKQ